MIISDANPIQFWLNGELTFNQTPEDGVVGQYFEQLFNAGDQIVIQFSDPGSNFAALALDMNTGAEIGHFAFTAPASTTDIWEASFTLASVNNRRIVIFIIDASDDVSVQYAPSTWTNGADAFTTKNATQFGVNGVLGTAYSASHALPGPIAAGVTLLPIRIDIDTTAMSGPFPICVVDVSLWNDAGLTQLAGHAFLDFQGGALYSLQEFIITTSKVANYIQVKYIASGTGAVVLTMHLTSVIYSPLENMLAQSGAISVQTSHPKTRLIKCSNKLNFAGLDFTNDEVFALRVTGKFFEQRTPQESESENFSDGVVEMLSDTLKSQKLLQVEPSPYFMHKKLALMLRMNSVKVDNDYVTVEEPYEPKIMDERYPFYIADCWLTLRDSFVTNVFGDFDEI